MKDEFEKEEKKLICQTVSRFFVTVGAISAIVCEGLYGLLVVAFLIFFYIIVTEG